MGFLHKLWDETLAGPTPDTGLGKLRKYNSLSAATRPPPVVVAPEDVPISRSITIVRTHSNFRTSSSSSSPSSSELASPSITPRTPLTPETPGGDFKKFTRRKGSADSPGSSDNRSPTIYDWVIMSALDRC